LRCICLKNGSRKVVTGFLSDLIVLVRFGDGSTSSAALTAAVDHREIRQVGEQKFRTKLPLDVAAIL